MRAALTLPWAGSATLLLSVAALAFAAVDHFAGGMASTWPAVAMAAGLLLGWCGARVTARRPIGSLLDTVHRVADGDLSARTEIDRRRDDEIGRLAYEVDRMAEALASRDRALTEARDRAQLYLDIVGVMVLALNGKGNVMLANRKVYEVIGCGGDGRCLGANWFDNWVVPEERAAAMAWFGGLMNADAEAPPTYYQEHRVCTVHGRQRLIAWQTTPLRDASGNIAGVLAAGHDITELRRTAEELLDSRNRYQALVENIPGAVYRCSIRASGRIEHVSAAIAALTGVAAERFIDGSVRYTDFIHPDDLPAVTVAIREGMEARRPHVVEYRLRHLRDGTWRWVVERGQATCDEEGRPVWLDGVIADIHERKLAEADRVQLQAQLQQAQKMEVLGQLTGGFAHDFNNIIASVMGFAKLALRRHVPEANSELAGYLREVVAGAERARDLVARMLAFSRARLNRRSAPPAPVAPQPLVVETIALLGAAVPAGVRVETHFAEDLPAVAIDPVDFHQILMNLVVNARDAIGEKGRIDIGLARRRLDQAQCAICRHPFEGDFLELSVADDGPGIPPSVLPHIFEPFFTTKAADRGTGMGLSMVKSLLLRADGHVVVDCAGGGPQPGCVFRVYFPCAVAASQPLAAAVAAAPLGATADDRRVLVVDDDASILRLLATALDLDGWRTEVFADPGAALARFRQAPGDFDVVVTDQSMPGMSGTELIAALHVLRPGLPAILCTGYADGMNEISAHRHGVSRFMRKPVDIDELLAALAGELGDAGDGG